MMYNRILANQYMNTLKTNALAEEFQHGGIGVERKYPFLAWYLVSALLTLALVSL